MESPWKARILAGIHGLYTIINLTLLSAQVAHAWGAIDFVPSPELNFPNWRNISTINGKDTGIMLIPREDDKIRLYIELGAEDGLVNSETGRLDKDSFPADRLLEVMVLYNPDVTLGLITNP